MNSLLAITYFMAFLGLWAVSLVESAGAAFSGFSALVTAASFYFNTRSKKTVPAGVWNAFGIAAFVFFILDFMANGQLAASAARFLSLLLGLKLFALKRNRDYLIAFGLVLFEVLAAATSTVSISFFMILALYVVSSIWAMIIFSMRRDLYEAERRTDLPEGVPGAKFYISVVVLSAASLLLTLALFFIMPRMGAGFLEGKNLNALKVTGFSDSVDIGAIGSVKEDSTVVMRVEFPAGKPAGPVYFRGLALDRYDGRSWSVEPKKSFFAKKSALGFEVGRPSARLTEQRILLEPLETAVIFAASNPVRVEGGFPNLSTDGAGSMRLPSPPFSGIEYRAWSDMSDIRRGGQPPAPGTMDASYLEKSPEGASIKAIAVQAAAGTAPLERARSIERFLKTNYKYRLSPALGSGKTPLEDFLLRTKEGYCEHFATAMAVMLRASGIPSRVVTGFLEGEWNGVGGYFMVRQQDAHSWVEAYMEGLGWMRFDPTPSAAARKTPSLIMLYLDLASLRWNSYIIQYSFTDQRQGALIAEEKMAEALKEIKKLLRGGSNGIDRRTVALAAAIVMILLVAAYSLKAARGSKGRKLPGYYAKMLSIFAKRKIVPGSAETPLEFALRTGDADAQFVTALFLKERYGGYMPGKEDLTEAGKALSRLRAGRSRSPSR